MLRDYEKLMNKKAINILKIDKVNFSYPIHRWGFIKNRNITDGFSLLDISLSLYAGESVGIIGQNGSGKSTLAKVISGVYQPDKGKIYSVGKKSPLIELGAGFDHELSAKENIYLYGLLIGISYGFLKMNYKDILKFSGLEKFENYPLRTFSSGMLARLAFSIATCFTPDLLIIDEALSVGDKEFIKISKSRINSLLNNGAAIVLISHDFEAIKLLTSTCIWLENGRIKEVGGSDFITDQYMKAVR